MVERSPPSASIAYSTPSAMMRDDFVLFSGTAGSNDQVSAKAAAVARSDAVMIGVFMALS